ncbi:hypothetical protein BLOT_004671 [Blomia tropicalis]|nr:hypothetical protein BLOT_004671 [Blomia tropicalis]
MFWDDLNYTIPDISIQTEITVSSPFAVPAWIIVILVRFTVMIEAFYRFYSFGINNDDDGHQVPILAENYVTEQY